MHCPSSSTSTTTTMKKRDQVRIFVRHPRHRFPSTMFRRSKTNEIEELTTMVENAIPKQKKSSRSMQNTIVINYKPVFMNNRPSKPKTSPIPSPPIVVPVSPVVQTVQPPPSPPPPQQQQQPSSIFTNKSIPTIVPQMSLQMPEAEDPFVFIEQMYQQLFTEDGQLRQGTEPTMLANCMKQIVNNSRRNSMTRRDSIASSIHPQKSSTSFSWLHPLKSSQAGSFSSSSHILSNTFSEEDEVDEEPETIIHKQQSNSESRKRMSNKRSSINLLEHQRRQDLHRFLDQSRRASMNTNPSQHVSIDDTENEELDPLSDCHTCGKMKRLSPGMSMDGDATHLESKLLSSSGYQSMKSQSLPICPNCTQLNETPATQSNIFVTVAHLVQRVHVPLRDLLVKYLQILLISKNILLVPLFVFALRQRTLPLGH